jgi:hypothetical protein
MNIEKIAPFTIALALAAASDGQLPKLLNTIRRAQGQLVHKTKASTWPKAPILKPFK